MTIKTKKGTLTALQKAQIARLEALGQDVRVVKGVDGLSQFFRDLGFAEEARETMRKHGPKDGKGGGAQ